MAENDTRSDSGSLSPLGRAIGQIILVVIGGLMLWVGATIHSVSVKLEGIETDIKAFHKTYNKDLHRLEKDDEKMQREINELMRK